MGRNVNLFNRLRFWSYKAIRQGWPNADQWDIAVLDRAVGYNAAGYHDEETQRSPLPYSEVRNTAKSVSKWTYKHFSQRGFSELQAARGARKGKKRRDELMPQVLKMRAQGVLLQAIADELDVPRRTVSRWLKQGVGQSHIR